MMLKIGLVGCGTIGSELARAVERDFKDRAKLAGLFDIDRARALSLAESLAEPPLILSVDELIDASDLVVEAASASVSGDLARKAILAGKDVMVMSIGGLIESDIFDLAERNGRYLYIPSGAICGLDSIKSARIGGISRVTLTTRKPPAGLRGAPYIVEHGIDLDTITKETTIFQGSAREAIRGFPKNVNVAVALSFAGIGIDKTEVRIISSPHFTTNSHEVTVEGEFGRLTTRTDNVPSPQNPKTSYLAMLSAVATLQGILSRSRIGT